MTMETLIRMITLFAWIAVIGCPILIVIGTSLQNDYDGSISQKIDRMQGYEMNYSAFNEKAMVIFVIALVFLIIKK